MDTIYSYKKRLILFALTWALSNGAVQAQYYSQFQAMPAPDQSRLTNDQQTVQSLKADADNYSNQVNEYVSKIREQSAAIDAQKQEYTKQSEELEKTIRDNPKNSKEAQAELSSLRTKIQHDDLLKQQATKYIDTALAWVGYVQAQVNNANFTVTEDQQVVDSDAQKVEEAYEERGTRAQLRELALQGAICPYPVSTPYYPHRYYHSGRHWK